MDDLVYTYDPKKNPHNEHLDGVPRRDLTLTEFAALAPKLQESVRRTPFYVPVKKKTTKKDGES